MYEQLKINQLVYELRQVSSQFTDVRTGENSQYAVRDAAMSAFSVFFTQTPSFLAYQRDMQLRKGQSNAKSLFGLDQLPSDNQIRNLLDLVDAPQTEGMYRYVFLERECAELLGAFRSFANQLLIMIDGTEYFSSKKIHCTQCSHQEGKDGKSRYFHSALTSVIA